MTVTPVSERRGKYASNCDGSGSRAQCNKLRIPLLPTLSAAPQALLTSPYKEVGGFSVEVC